MTSGVTAGGGGGAGRVLPWHFSPENVVIFAELPLKEAIKKGKMEKRRKKENCNREGGNFKLEENKQAENPFFFFFSTFHFLKPL